jgi:hypothetical protein
MSKTDYLQTVISDLQRTAGPVHTDSQKATSPTKAGELIEDQFASVARQALWLCNIGSAMMATKIICLSDVRSDGSIGKADLWDGFAGSRKTAAETF